MSEAKFSPLLRHVRHTQLRRMGVQRDPQWVLDVCAERDALRAEVAQLRSLPARLQQIVTTRHESTTALAARVRNTLEDYQ